MNDSASRAPTWCAVLKSFHSHQSDTKKRVNQIFWNWFTNLLPSKDELDWAQMFTIYVAVVDINHFIINILLSPIPKSVSMQFSMSNRWRLCMSHSQGSMLIWVSECVSTLWSHCDREYCIFRSGHSLLQCWDAPFILKCPHSLNPPSQQKLLEAAAYPLLTTRCIEFFWWHVGLSELFAVAHCEGGWSSV